MSIICQIIIIAQDQTNTKFGKWQMRYLLSSNIYISDKSVFDKAAKKTILFCDKKINVYSALEPLIVHLSMSLQNDFQNLCDDFRSTFQIDADEKSQIVNAIDTAGWDFVGVDFFQFLGNLTMKNRLTIRIIFDSFMSPLKINFQTRKMRLLQQMRSL